MAPEGGCRRPSCTTVGAGVNAIGHRAFAPGTLDPTAPGERRERDARRPSTERLSWNGVLPVWVYPRSRPSWASEKVVRIWNSRLLELPVLSGKETGMFESLFVDDQDASVRRVGRFQGDRFVLAPWLGCRRGVYFFVLREGDQARVLRIGSAFGSGGLRGRFDLHNRWLLGVFKPEVAEEQAARAFMLEGLSDRVEVWAWLLDDSQIGRSFERVFRRAMGASLRLDRAAQGSWMKMRVAAWRGSPLSEKALHNEFR